jgi:putative ABC transport system permease protein
LRTLTLVSKNLSRRKARAIISSIGLILAISVIVATFTVSAAMQAQIGNELDKYGPNIVVTSDTQSINVPYGSVVIGNVLFSEESIYQIYEIPNKANIRVVSPKLYNQIQFNNHTLLVVGTIPEKELELKMWWNITGALPENDTNQVLLGSQVNSVLNLPVGSAVTLNNESFTVAGFLAETGSIDDYTVFMPLHTAQALFSLEGKISEADVGALCNDCPVEELAQQIMDVVPDVKATPIKQAVETRMQAVQQTANFSLVLAAIILVVGFAGIMNTMLASVHERIKEIGVFMSLGADNRHLYRMFLSESTLLGLIGGVVGTAAGVIASLIMGPLLINVSIGLGDLPLFVIPLSVGLSVGASVAASLYPTWRASKIDPVKALKAV